MSLASTRLPRDMCEPTVNDTSTGQLSDAQIAQVPTSSHLQTAKLLLAGGVSGAVSKTATAPLARMTILYQLGAVQSGAGVVGLSQGLCHVVRREGILALWKGNGVTIIHRLPYTAASFYCYEQANQQLKALIPHSENGTAASDSLRRLLAGGIGGSVGCVAAYPLDLVRTLVAGDTGNGRAHRGGLQMIRDILRQKGLAGMYRGLGPTLLQAGPNLAINYCVYESLRSKWLSLHPHERMPPVPVMLACGSTAGIVSSTFTFPLDVVRRRMQMQALQLYGGRWQYSGMGNAIVTIAQHEGIRGFYRGLVPEYIKVAPGVAITYMTYEFMKKLLLGEDFNSSR